MQQLGSADVAWLRMESPVNPMVVVGLLQLGEPMEVGQLRRLLVERLLVIGRFRQRIVLDGRPRWESYPGFDIDHHVRAARVPRPAARADLERLVNELLGSELDMSLPPWQAYVIEDYDGGAAIIMVLHHAIADGIALVQVLLSLADEHFDELDPETLPTYDDGPAPRRRGVRSALRRRGEGLSHGRVRLGLHLTGAAWHIATLPMDSTTRFKQPATRAKRAAWSEPMPLQTVRLPGAKINDIVLTAVAGGLRRYLLAKGEPVNNIEIGTVIPVNLRPPEEAFELGNHFGIVFLSLPIGIADVTERLREVQRRMDQLKGSGEPIVALGILKAIGAGPRFLHRKVVDVLSAKSSAVVTNVPGPTERLHLDGIPLSEVMYWVPRSGALGLGVSIISYDDTISFGVAVDAQMASDPDVIVKGMLAELSDLRRALDPSG